MTINFYNPSFSFEEDKASCYWFLQSFLLYTRVKIAALFSKIETTLTWLLNTHPLPWAI